MNIPLTKREYEQLPYRDDAPFYFQNARYRAKAHPRLVFRFVGKDENHPEWQAFRVEIVDDPHVAPV